MDIFQLQKEAHALVELSQRNAALIDQFVAALRPIVEGPQVLVPSSAKPLAASSPRGLVKARELPPAQQKLTGEQRMLAAMAGRWMKAQEVAEATGLSVNSVYTLVSKLWKKHLIRKRGANHDTEYTAATAAGSPSVDEVSDEEIVALAKDWIGAAALRLALSLRITKEQLQKRLATLVRAKRLEPRGKKRFEYRALEP